MERRATAVHEATALILAAAGSGTRVGGSVPKQFLLHRGRPLYQLSLEAFLPRVAQVVVVVPQDHVKRVAEELESCMAGVDLVVTGGGRTRQESVWLGLRALRPGIRYVLVHDAARPRVSPFLIDRVLTAAVRHGACLPVLPVTDTVKEVREERVIRTLPRDSLALAQTPQGFSVSLLENAMTNAEREGILATDESMLVEELGAAVATVEGEAENLKITWPEDLARLEEEAADAMTGIRVGHGFDFHPFRPGRTLVLGGVQIPFEQGLAGHSDADALAHALADALLGAAGLEDIGSHFPDTDQRYRGISSLVLLAEVVELVRSRGFRIGNADLTILAEVPRMRPHVAAMKANLAQCLGIPEERVGIKATTMEGCGAVGRKEGIAAAAVVLLQAELQAEEAR